MERQAGAVEEVFFAVFGEDAVGGRFDNFVLGVVDKVFDLGEKFVNGSKRLGRGIRQSLGVIQNPVDALHGQHEFMQDVENLNGGESNEKGQGGDNYD